MLLSLKGDSRPVDGQRSGRPDELSAKFRAQWGPLRAAKVVATKLHSGKCHTALWHDIFIIHKAASSEAMIGVTKYAASLICILFTVPIKRSSLFSFLTIWFPWLLHLGFTGDVFRSFQCMSHTKTVLVCVYANLREMHLRYCGQNSDKAGLSCNTNGDNEQKSTAAVVKSLSTHARCCFN